MKKVLILDNYDSFTFNLYQIVAELGGNPVVRKNDEIFVDDPTHIIISPGPGTPNHKKDIGNCEKIIKKYIGKIPILGVCLGHQIIAHMYGGRIINAQEVVHGKTSKIVTGESSGIFKGLPKEIDAMRYHSLIVDEKTFPRELRITARTKKDNLIMAFEHSHYALFGIQFHPESFATKYGKKIVENFILMLN